LGICTCSNDLVVCLFDFVQFQSEVSIRPPSYITSEEARAEIFDYIEVFYNRARWHQYPGNISPGVYEEQMAKSG